MPLNLYLIARQDEPDRAELRSLVVAAPTAAMARQSAREVEEGSQSPEVWATANATLTKIGTATPRVKQGVLHTDMTNG